MLKDSRIIEIYIDSFIRLMGDAEHIVKQENDILHRTNFLNRRNNLEAIRREYKKYYDRINKEWSQIYSDSKEYVETKNKLGASFFPGKYSLYATTLTQMLVENFFYQLSTLTENCIEANNPERKDKRTDSVFFDGFFFGSLRNAIEHTFPVVVISIISHSVVINENIRKAFIQTNKKYIAIPYREGDSLTDNGLKQMLLNMQKQKDGAVAQFGEEVSNGNWRTEPAVYRDELEEEAESLLKEYIRKQMNQEGSNKASEPNKVNDSYSDKKISNQTNGKVPSQSKKMKKQKYWLDEKGVVRCPGDACPIECDTDCPIYAQTLALQKLQQNDFEGAAKLLRIATSIEPSFGDAWNNLAACYGQMGDHKNAFAAFQRSYEINPKPNPLYGMVVATKNMKEYDLARMFARTYVTKFGSDDRITALIKELPGEESVTKPVAEKKTTAAKAEQAAPETHNLSHSMMGTHTLVHELPDPEPVTKNEPEKVSIPAFTVPEVSVEDMRRFGKYYLLLLDPDTREAGYAAMEKMENDFPEAAICLGQYYNGTDQGKAKKHIRIAANAGIAEGQWSYSQLLPHSRILDLSEVSDKEYLKYCLAAAEGGCPDAANEMGNICHRSGYYEESTYWYGMAYALEHPDGMISLRGITKEWLQKGISKEYRAFTDSFTEERRATALLILELFTQSDIDRALDDLMKLALKGENLAGFMLAEVYEKNSQDDMAYTVYNALAVENHPHALRCYADMLIAGKGTEKDMDAAFRMYEQSAKGGNATAMFVMGQKAEKDGDRNLAACWFGQAYSRGFEAAGEWLSKLAE